MNLEMYRPHHIVNQIAQTALIKFYIFSNVFNSQQIINKLTGVTVLHICCHGRFWINFIFLVFKWIGLCSYGYISYNTFNAL